MAEPCGNRKHRSLHAAESSLLPVQLGSRWGPRAGAASPLLPAPAHLGPALLSQARLGSPQGFGGPEVHIVQAAARAELSFLTAPDMLGFMDSSRPGTTFGCRDSSLNHCSAICWPTPLSTEDPPRTLLAPAGPGCPLGRSTGPEATHTPELLLRKHHHLP